MKQLILAFSSLILFACSNDDGLFLPNGKLTFKETDHCWPYELKVFYIDDDLLENELNGFPKRGFFENGDKYTLQKWMPFNELDHELRQHITNQLMNCESVNIYDEFPSEKIYISGIFQYFKTNNGELKRRYEEFVLLDASNSLLYLFNDINELY